MAMPVAAPNPEAGEAAQPEARGEAAYLEAGEAAPLEAGREAAQLDAGRRSPPWARPVEVVPAAPEETFRRRPAGHTGPWSPLSHLEAEIERLLPASRRVAPAVMRQFAYAMWEAMRPNERARYRGLHHRQRGELMREARREANRRGM